MDKVKILSGSLLVILVLNIILISLGKIRIALFWIIIGVAALFAYVILPRLRTQKKE